jgi:hypothetical protein
MTGERNGIFVSYLNYSMNESSPPYLAIYLLSIEIQMIKTIFSRYIYIKSLSFTNILCVCACIILRVESEMMIVKSM